MLHRNWFLKVVNLITRPHKMSHQWVPVGLLQRREGSLVPVVNFFFHVKNVEGVVEWKVFSSGDVFTGKRVVVFAVPGAFTHTCSTAHLPGYKSAYEEIKKNGVDEVYCLSVNDAPTMRKWGLDQGMVEDTGKDSKGFLGIKMLADGAALFTRQMGMSTIWDVTKGLGERSWRYSMVVDDGVIEKLFVEPGKVDNTTLDPLTVSGVGEMLKYLRDFPVRF